MKIVIVGAGVIGVCTAWHLAQDGHEIHVLDGAGLARAASAVNANLLVPGDSIVWSSPGVRHSLARTIVGHGEAGVALRPSAGPAILPWGMRFLRESTSRRYQQNAAAAYRLSGYSYAEMERLAGELAIDYGGGRTGMVLLFDSERSREEALHARAPLAALGVPYQCLSSSGLTALDPAFAAAAERWPYTVYTPAAGHGDCRTFALALTTQAERVGVRFRLGYHVTALLTESGAVTGVRTEFGTVRADRVVLAAGSGSPQLARTAGVSLPIQPARGYSVTVAIADRAVVPRIGGIAEDVRVAFSATGGHVRISSGAEFAGPGAAIPPDAYAGIKATADELFGDALDWGDCRRDSGLRPVTPTGLPMIGATGRPNLLVNTGHGHLGWTQACGSALLLRDIVAGREPGIPAEPYRPRDTRRPSRRVPRVVRSTQT